MLSRNSPWSGLVAVGGERLGEARRGQERPGWGWGCQVTQLTTHRTLDCSPPAELISEMVQSYPTGRVTVLSHITRDTSRQRRCSVMIMQRRPYSFTMSPGHVILYSHLVIINWRPSHWEVSHLPVLYTALVFPSSPLLPSPFEMSSLSLVVILKITNLDFLIIYLLFIIYLWF